MWNAETAQFLHDWYATPEGTYAITQENRLFQHLISQWPRRGHTLLDIGCGAGIFLEMLWHYGFDVTGLDTGTDLLDMARERLGNRAEFQLGRPEHLPFDDEEFDYAALLTVLEYVDNPEDVLREAIRVSHRGVIIGFMNSFSLYQICLLYTSDAADESVPRPPSLSDPYCLARQTHGRKKGFGGRSTACKRRCPSGHISASASTPCRVSP